MNFLVFLFLFNIFFFVVAWDWVDGEKKIVEQDVFKCGQLKSLCDKDANGSHDNRSFKCFHGWGKVQKASKKNRYLLVDNDYDVEICQISPKKCKEIGCPYPKPLNQICNMTFCKQYFTVSYGVLQYWWYHIVVGVFITFLFVLLIILLCVCVSKYTSEGDGRGKSRRENKDKRDDRRSKRKHEKVVKQLQKKYRKRISDQKREIERLRDLCKSQKENLEASLGYIKKSAGKLEEKRKVIIELKVKLEEESRRNHQKQQQEESSSSDEISMDDEMDDYEMTTYSNQYGGGDGRNYGGSSHYDDQVYQ